MRVSECLVSDVHLEIECWSKVSFDQVTKAYS